MTNDAPLFPRPLHLSPVARQAARHGVLTTRELRAHGVPAGVAGGRCRPGGPWQRLLPGVYLLHSGPPSGEERVQAALRYAAGRTSEALVTGLAALALHGLAGAPELDAVRRIDVLVPRTRRLRSVGCARLVRAHSLPRPGQVGGFPVAPVARALADAVGSLSDAVLARRLLITAVRGGHCEPQAVVREFSRTRVLARPHVVRAVETLLDESRALAEEQLREMVYDGGLPDPCWNVELHLPSGAYLGGVDAYWPDHAVAVEIDARVPRGGAGAPVTAPLDLPAELARKRQILEGLGIALVLVTPRALRTSREGPAAVVRTALLAAADRLPAVDVRVLPR